MTDCGLLASELSCGKYRDYVCSVIIAFCAEYHLIF